MFDSFYIETTNFEKYGWEHFVSVLLMALFGIWFLRKGKTFAKTEEKWRFALNFALIIYAVQLFKSVFRYFYGTFDITKDLPLHLCNLLPLFMIIALWKKNRTLLGIFFFWIMAGTIQANITPDLKNTFPHYEAIRYWIVHSGLPILAIYTVYVLNINYTFKDAILSAISLNVVAAIIYPINLMIGSNYLYLNQKPDPGTIYDILGPWPWYILSLEGLMFILFTLILGILKFLRRR